MIRCLLRSAPTIIARNIVIAIEVTVPLIEMTAGVHVPLNILVRLRLFGVHHVSPEFFSNPATADAARQSGRECSDPAMYACDLTCLVVMIEPRSTQG